MPEKTFSQKLQRLEEIVAKLESPDIELEEGLKLLEEGVALHKDCQKVLTQSQTKITKLLNADGEGAPVAEPVQNDKDSEAASLFESVEQNNSEGKSKPNNDDTLPF